MKKIIWKVGLYRYRNSSIGYINNVQVAVISPHHDGSRFDAICLLPGLPKGTNVFGLLEGAKKSLEERVNHWFELVSQ